MSIVAESKIDGRVIFIELQCLFTFVFFLFGSNIRIILSLWIYSIIQWLVRYKECGFASYYYSKSSLIIDGNMLITSVSYCHYEIIFFSNVNRKTPKSIFEVSSKWRKRMILVNCLIGDHEHREILITLLGFTVYQSRKGRLYLFVAHLEEFEQLLFFYHIVITIKIMSFDILIRSILWTFVSLPPSLSLSLMFNENSYLAVKHYLSWISWDFREEVQRMNDSIEWVLICFSSSKWNNLLFNWLWYWCWLLYSLSSYLKFIDSCIINCF